MTNNFITTNEPEDSLALPLPQRANWSTGIPRLRSPNNSRRLPETFLSEMPVRAQQASCRDSLALPLSLHVRVLLSFQQPTFQQTQDINACSAAQVVISFVSSEIMTCRLLNWLLDHPVTPPSPPSLRRHQTCRFRKRAAVWLSHLGCI